MAITAGVGWLHSDSEDSPRPDVAAPGVPADALNPPGTPLPNGFTVPEGAALVATPVLYGQPYRDATPDWRAVLLVDDDPIATWSAVLSQMASVLGTELDADTPEGCRMYKEQLSCSIDRAGPAGPGVELRVTARLRTVPTDVTGHYTIQLHARRTVPNPYDTPPSHPWPGGDPPDAPAARPRPAVGEQLAPQTLPGETEPVDDFPLLEGSELLVQYEFGEFGGFGVLLRVLPGADVDAVGLAYAEQATMSDGPIREGVTETDGMTATVYDPPGAAGGYHGTVYAVDNASGADYVYYEISHDY